VYSSGVTPAAVTRTSTLSFTGCGLGIPFAADRHIPRKSFARSRASPILHKIDLDLSFPRRRQPNGFRRIGLRNVDKLHDLCGKAVLGKFGAFSLLIFLCACSSGVMMAAKCGVQRGAAPSVPQE